MKKILFTLVAACLLIVSCNSLESLLDTTNYSKSDTSNFPKTEKDATQIVNSIYAARAAYGKDPKEQPTWRNNAAADEMIGGGNTETQGQDRLLEDSAENLADSWAAHYKSIFRANFAIESIDKLEDNVFSSVDYKNYLIGQAYFLRGWTYWELAELFETVPIVTTTEPVNNPRASADSVFTQIANDLTAAIGLMSPKYDYTDGTSETTARATKYAAEAALARVWMFYTGFYKQSTLAGITKDQIISYLKDIVNNSHFGLVADPREIWCYTNDYSSGVAYGTDFGTYANKENLHWLGNCCKESIFVTHFSLVDNDNYNRMSDYTGIRGGKGYKNPDADGYPWSKGGYYALSVNSDFVKNWIEDPDYGVNDKRLWGSIFCTGSNTPDELPWMAGQYIELPNCAMENSDAISDQLEDTHFRTKKYNITLCYDGAEKKKFYNVFFKALGSKDDRKTGDRSDIIHIRYADVLLMLDELQQSVDGMNQLRTRAGLAPYSNYTFERLQKERSHELCFEGFRFTDLRRWYPETAGQIIDEAQKKCHVYYLGTSQMWKDVTDGGPSIAERYSKSRGFWMVPVSEINLSDGTLTQTPGWEGDTQWAKARLPYKK